MSLKTPWVLDDTLRIMRRMHRRVAATLLNSHWVLGGMFHYVGKSISSVCVFFSGEEGEGGNGSFMIAHRKGIIMMMRMLLL